MGRGRVKRRRVYTLSFLGSAATTAHGTASTAGLEVTTRCITADAASATRSTTAGETSTIELSRVLTALFDLELDTVDRVRVGGDRGLVASGGLEVDESAVLQKVSWAIRMSKKGCLPCHG